MTQRTPSPAAVDYPSGDGKPLAENDWQLRAIFDSFTALDHHFRDRPDVYVSSDLLIYHEEGNPRARAAPDVFVVYGVPKHKRPVYKLWEEGVTPAFVLEVASRGTWREDEGRKAQLYERLGVREYFQHDPTGEYLGLRLKGRRLVRGAYEPLRAVEYLDGASLLRSDTLCLDVRVKGEEICFLEPGTGRRILKYAELDAARQAAESRAETAESRAEAAEARIAELEALLRAQGG
ncbi:MAG: Uma2 family endonuclease [Immundisolibacterales bacterium]|nr:Uma2 family endonuclease [Immundisolibacterales bacterium]